MTIQVTSYFIFSLIEDYFFNKSKKENAHKTKMKVFLAKTIVLLCSGMFEVSFLIKNSFKNHHDKILFMHNVHSFSPLWGGERFFLKLDPKFG